MQRLKDSCMAFLFYYESELTMYMRVYNCIVRNFLN